MTKTSKIPQHIKSYLTPYLFLPPDFFNVQKQNNLQGNGSYSSYLESTPNLTPPQSEINLDYMKATLSQTKYSILDYRKYNFDSKDLKFNRDEINERS